MDFCSWSFNIYFFVRCCCCCYFCWWLFSTLLFLFGLILFEIKCHDLMNFTSMQNGYFFPRMKSIVWNSFRAHSATKASYVLGQCGFDQTKCYTALLLLFSLSLHVISKTVYLNLFTRMHKHANDIMCAVCVCRNTPSDIHSHPLDLNRFIHVGG